MSEPHDEVQPRASHDERLVLPIEHSALLWCMRVWVVGLHRPIGAERRIQEMLDRLGAPEAAPYVEGFMFTLSHGAMRRIAVDCPCRPRLSEDERALLDVLALAQDARPFEALLLLRGLLTPEAARAALRSAEGIGEALRRAGRLLRAPEAEVRRFALAAGSAAVIRPAGATLH